MQNNKQKAVMAKLRKAGVLSEYEKLPTSEKSHVMTFAGLEKTNFDLSNASPNSASKIIEGLKMNKLLNIKLSRSHNQSMISTAKYDEKIKDKYAKYSQRELSQIFHENQHGNDIQQQIAGEVHRELYRREKHGRRNAVRYPSSGSRPI